jgi:hypothetical protein
MNNKTMVEFNVKNENTFVALQEVSISLIQPVLDFLETDLSNFKKDNSTRGNFFDGSTFIRFPNATFVHDANVYDYLYKINFCGIKTMPKRHRLAHWDYLCSLIIPLINFIKINLPESCEPIGAEINVLPPGVNILRHYDRHPLTIETHRVHIVLCTNKESLMISDTESKHWPQGSCFIFNNRDYHSVENNGTSPRAHLVVDFLPIRYLEYIKNAHIL